MPDLNEISVIYITVAKYPKLDLLFKNNKKENKHLNAI